MHISCSRTASRLLVLALASFILPSAAPAQQRVSAPRADGGSTPLLVYPALQPAQPAAGCPPLAVISHGAGGSENGYRYLAEAMAGMGYTTIVMGHRESGLPALMADIRDGYTYMYFKEKPLYPFGFGLSYTTFKFSNIKSSSPRLAKDGKIAVSVDVTNTGDRAGDEVVQLYVQHLHSAVSRPREELEGFQRVTIDAGQTKTVEIPLAASQLGYWDVKTNAFRVEAEPVSLMIGNSSADLPQKTTVQVE